MPAKTFPDLSVETFSDSLNQLRSQIGETVRGKADVIDQVVICLIAGGHLLIEDLPGVGKTTLAYALSRALDGSFSRIQFTSDLLPSDVIGVSVLRGAEREFEFRPGPIFANVILADEINRATPKTQSALLEVMDRGKVSVDGDTFDTPKPFMVFATQNPVDYEGTFPLPQSQMDRFLMRIQMGYPEGETELEVLRDPQMSYDSIDPKVVFALEQISEIQATANAVFVEESVLRFMLAIVQATRTESEFKNGVSTRGAIALKRASQARAVLQKRNFVTPADVLAEVRQVFVHRLTPFRQTADALQERRHVEEVLERILESIPEPM
ncbi:MAG: MoxR family ATPase [Verrucomicrobiota bacterium]